MPRKFSLHQAIFTNDDAARTALEALRWPNGRVCPNCSSLKVAEIGGEKRSHRDGLYRCADCRKQFTVTVGTVLHGSKVPLSLWMQVIRLEAVPDGTTWATKQITGLDYKTVERMRARIYEAVGHYRGPNRVFGQRVGRYVTEQRPRGYQTPPKLRKSRGGEGINFRPYYTWREKHPLDPKPEMAGVLTAADSNSRDTLKLTEMLLSHLIKAAPVKLRKKRVPTDHGETHVGWLPGAETAKKRRARRPQERIG